MGANWMILKTYGYHEEARKGEVLIGYFHPHFFESMITWETKRIGKKRFPTGEFIGKFPVFILEKEAVDAGWSVK